jgi:hypothetical protein
MPDARDEPIHSPTAADAIPPGLRRRGGGSRHVLALCIVGSLVLALFASRDLPSWAERFADSPGAQTLQRLATAWDDRMAALCLTRPHEILRDAIRRALDARW